MEIVYGILEPHGESKWTIEQCTSLDDFCPAQKPLLRLKKASKQALFHLNFRFALYCEADMHKDNFLNKHG